MSTTPRLWKSQTQVNTTDAAYPGRGGTNFQYDSQIAALPDGGYVVVWTDFSRTYNPAGYAVLGQRYDSAGNRVGGEVNISQLSTGDQSQPAVTVLANGNIAVAFTDRYSGNSDIYVRVFDSSLGTVRLDFIDTGLAQLATFGPSLAALADGSYVVSYMVESGDDTDVVARRVSATGAVGAQFDIHNEPDTTLRSELATLSNGNFVAVYEDDVNGNTSNSDILFKVFTAAGTPAAVAGGVVPGAGGSGLERDPDVAALRDGGFVVVWTDPDSTERDIRASVLSNAGGTVASDILVNTTTAGIQNGASVVALADGGFLVSWQDDSADLIRAQRFDAAGGKIGTEFVVKNGVAGQSSGATVLGDGRIAFAVADDSTGDYDVTSSIWTPNGRDAIGPINISAAGDFNSDGMQGYIWRDAGAAMAMTEYNATARQVTHVELGPVGFSWNILAGDHFSNVTNTQMLTQNTADGTMTLWWTSSGQLTGVNIGQKWNGIDYLTNGQFTDSSGIANFLVANAADHHLYDWWIDANNTLQGIDLGAVWSNKSLVGTGEFTPNGKTDFLVANEGDHHLYNWWIDPASHTLQGYDLGAAWNNVGYIASGKFTANGGDNDNFLVFNESDHHLYNWWIDPVSHTLQGVDLGAAWNNVELLATGHFSSHTAGDQFLVRNTVDNHWYEWWIDPASHTLQGIDLGARPGIELVEYTGYLNNNSNEFLVHNTTDGDFYEWWISNNQLTGVDLII